MAYNSPLEFSGNPLASDDRNLNNPMPLEFSGSPAGLDISRRPTAPLGMQNTGAGIPGFDMNAANAQLNQMMSGPLSTPKPASTQPRMFYSPSTGEMVINGFPFNQRDASRALASRQYATQPSRDFTLPNTATDWRPMSPEEYTRYIDSIENPSYGRRMEEAWEHAWRGMGDVAVGAGLAVAEATGNEWEWGQEARQNLAREFEENAPFMMQLRQVENVGDALTYMSQMAIQGVPWLIETAATMAAGAVIGGAVSGGAGAPAGAAQAFIAKEGIRRGAQEALRGTIQRGARAYEAAQLARGAGAGSVLPRELVIRHAVRNKIASADDVNRFFNFGERAYHLSRGGAAGATALAGATNYMVGVGDIRNTIADAGGDTETAEAIANIWGGAVPYALMETVGDLILTAPITRIFPNIARGPSRVGNALRQAGVVGVSEAAQETGQYLIAEQAASNVTGEPLTVQPMDLLEVAVAGALAGGGIGGLVGALGTPTAPRNAPRLPPPSTRLPDGTTPTPPTGGPGPVEGPSFADIYDASDVPGMTPQEGDPMYQADVLRERAMDMPVPVGGGIDTEREALGNTVSDPLATPEQRRSAMFARDALRENREVDVDAAARSRAGMGPGVTPMPPVPQQPMQQPDVGITQEEIDATLQDVASEQWARQQDPMEVDLPPGLSGQRPRQGQRSPTEIFQDLAMGREATPTEMQQLYTAIETLRQQNPTNPGYTQVLEQLSSMMRGDLNTAADYEARHPGLTEYMASKERPPEQAPIERTPMRRAGPITDTPEAKAARAKEMGEDGLPKYGPHRLKRGDGLRGRTEEAPVVIPKEEADPLGYLEDRVKKLKKNQKKKAQKKASKAKKREDDFQDKQAQEAIAATKRQGDKPGFRRDPERGDFYKGQPEEKIELAPPVTRAEQDKTPAVGKGRRIGLKQETKDAVQERGPTPKTVRDEPRTGKTDGSRDTAREEAAGPRADEARDEGVQGSQVDQVKVDKAYRDAIAEARKKGKEDPLRSARQSAAGIKSRLFDRNNNRIEKRKTTVEWAKGLNGYELHALIQKMDAERGFGPDATKPAPKATPKSPENKDLKRAQSFHNSVEDAVARNKTDSKALMTFFELAIADPKQLDDLYNWMDHRMSLLLPTARRMAERMAPNRPTNPKLMATPTAPKATKEEQEFSKGMWLHGTPNPKAAKGLRGHMLEPGVWITKAPKTADYYANKNKNAKNPLKKNNPTVVLLRLTGPVKIFDSYEAVDVTQAKRDGYVGWTVRNEDSEVNVFNKRYLAPWFSSDTAAETRTSTGYVEGPQTKHSIAEKPVKGKMLVTDVRAVVDDVQKKINQEYRFRSVHVFDDIEAFAIRMGKEKITDNDGNETTIAGYVKAVARELKRKHPELRDLTDGAVGSAWAMEYFGSSSAIVIPEFDALIVFNSGNKRDLIRVLEHEYIVHKGLAVFFPDRFDRAMFLTRLSSIPGIDAKRLEIVMRDPVYQRANYLEQLEEVPAFHAMDNGKLALEQLLKTKEGVDPTTKRSLWEDFVKMVKDWWNSVFAPHMVEGPKLEADMILDRVIEALRNRAMNSSYKDLNKILDSFDVQKAKEVAEDELTDRPKLAASINSTPTQDTAELLFGTKTDPGRPYTEVPYSEHLKNTIESNAALINKIKQIGNSSGSGIRERLRKIGRNVETMVNMSLRSELVDQTMHIMDNTVSTARRIMSKRGETRKYASVDAAFDKVNGSTEKQRAAYGKMAFVAANNKLPQTTDEVVNAAPRLRMRNVDGTHGVNWAVFKELLKRGTLTREEFEAGVEQFTVSGDGKTSSTGIATLPKDVINDGMRIYQLESRHMGESAAEVLEHALIMLDRKNDAMVRDLLEQVRLPEADQQFADEFLKQLYSLYSDIAFHKYGKHNLTHTLKQKRIAREVLVEFLRVMWKKEKMLDWLDTTRSRKTDLGPRGNDAFKWRELNKPHKDVEPFVAKLRWFLSKDPATGKQRLTRLNELGIGEQRQYDVLNAFQNLLNVETLAQEQENAVIQSILGNYVEFTRQGEWRVFINVVNPDKSKANVSHEFLSVLPASYTKTQREAKALQAKWAEEFAGTHKVTDLDGKVIDVMFDIGYETAPGVRTLSEAPKLREFMAVAEAIQLSMNAAVMERLAKAVANAEERKRFGLQRSGNPGADANILQNNNATMTMRAWSAAKMSQAWMLDDVFADERNIYGDPAKLQRLQDAFDIANRGAPEGQPVPPGFARNEEAVYLAEVELLRYANKLRYMSRHTLNKPTINIRTTKGEQKFKIEPEGRAHHKHAVELREALKRNELELDLNDLISETGPLRMVAVVTQLGSIASAIMNAFTLLTHLPAVLTARHQQTGYGEGFQLNQVVSEIINSTSHVFANWDMIDSAKLKDMVDKAKAGNNPTKLTLPELEYLYHQTLEGLLMPQQTYSMTGGTESNITNIALRNTAEAFLKPFSHIEAANRRVAALAMYRLAKERYVKAGGKEEVFNDQKSEEYRKLVMDTRRAVHHSQGHYANINAPKIFRGGLAKYVMLYKMFPLMTHLMIWNLPKTQQLAVLGIFFLLGGLKAEPFADDFMDIYDTLLQKLGFRHDSVELQLIRFFEEIMPGSSKWIMTGAVDTLAFGGTMSTRVSMGDILPLTGIFREGADLHREMEGAFGPAYSANVDILEYAWLLTDYTLQLTGIKTRINSYQDMWEQVIKKVPQSQLRALGEAGLMATSGEITDPRGRLVSDDVEIWDIFSRAIALYPLEATKANTAVRLDRMHTNYMKGVRARFVLAYANAYRREDQAGMDRIQRAVEDWNASARDTGREDMLIRNFGSAARRAGRMATQTTIERTASSAPRYSVLEEVASILDADTESEED